MINTGPASCQVSTERWPWFYPETNPFHDTITAFLKCRFSKVSNKTQSGPYLVFTGHAFLKKSDCWSSSLSWYCCLHIAPRGELSYTSNKVWKLARISFSCLLSAIHAYYNSDNSLLKEWNRTCIASQRSTQSWNKQYKKLIDELVKEKISTVSRLLFQFLYYNLLHFSVKQIYSSA